MHRSPHLLAGLLLGLSYLSEAATHAQPFIPKKPQDILPQKPEDIFPRKPEDLIPRLPPNETPLVGHTRITFQYTLWNSSGTTVRFRLPTGRVYTLRNGERGNYTFTGYKPHAVVHVLNTGRTYNLTGGDHKFWWMSKEQRVGLDLNYRYPTKAQ